MKRRRKLNKRGIIFLCFIIFVFIILLMPFVFINIKLIGDKNIELNYGEKYSEPGYKAHLFNKDITDSIIISNNIKENIGEYKVIYSYKFLFYNIKKVRIVKVSDLTGPKIELLGDKEVSITVGTSYEEAGYKAVDNLDGDVTKSVKTNNNINVNQLGEYEVVYEVKDKIGNLTKVVRKVKVEKLKPYLMPLKDYTLDGWYDSVKLKQTVDYGDEYFDRITMVGDSNMMNMYLSGYLKGKNAWALPCLHADSMHFTEINLYGLGTKMKLIDAVEKYKPEILLLNLGTFSTSWISEELFVEKANSIIDNIKEKSPDTKIILSSLYPIREGYNINSFKQETINKYNFLILEMAYNKNLKYLDVQEVLKNEKGYGRNDYFIDDKFHFTYSGFKKVKEYIKTHGLKEE